MVRNRIASGIAAIAVVVGGVALSAPAANAAASDAASDAAHLACVMTVGDVETHAGWASYAMEFGDFGVESALSDGKTAKTLLASPKCAAYRSTVTAQFDGANAALSAGLASIGRADYPTAVTQFSQAEQLSRDAFWILNGWA